MMRSPKDLHQEMIQGSMIRMLVSSHRVSHRTQRVRSLEVRKAKYEQKLRKLSRFSVFFRKKIDKIKWLLDRINRRIVIQKTMCEIHKTGGIMSANRVSLDWEGMLPEEFIRSVHRYEERLG